MLTQFSKINSTPPDLTLSLPFRSLEYMALGIMEDWQPGWDQSEASLNCESKTGELLLTWDNHRKNAFEAFSSLRKDVFFCDVTLACQDQQFKAHKVVLAASSLFFEQVLKHNVPSPSI